ncbi:FtsX-like permease family protein [Vacuolonema iberomarrocanum]|uniref:FtsX-like permease family protein n=1 Tax=Vacuolonema iberomarrocanum TaxID=3454632 RepID=UPI0019F6FF72|nr:FtsX-like permease family protein [filamentous cyanobacterium LEGE 07170]
MASVARKNLLEDIPRFLVAQAGVMFAVSLVTIQTGIIQGFGRSTTTIIDDSSADIWLSAEEMVNLQLTLPIPAATVADAEDVEGVRHAEALLTRTTMWRGPNGEIAPVQIIGFDPASTLFAAGNITAGDVGMLQEPHTILPDLSNLNSLGLSQVGDSANISSLPARVVGLTEGTQSLPASAYIFTSLRNANAYLTSGFNSSTNCRLEDGNLACNNNFQRTPDPTELPAPEPLSASDAITYVLVEAEPGQDLQALKQRIEEQLPNVRALTREEMSAQTRDFWVQRTGIGFILGLGATVGVVVGMVVVGQILYSSVSDHVKEFGTLKAMGASDWMIYRIIIEQAMWMAVLGYVPSVALCWAVGLWTVSAQGIAILITPVSAAGVLGITVLMCIGSAIIAIQRVTHVDPAIVFKA